MVICTAVRWMSMRDTFDSLSIISNLKENLKEVEWQKSDVYTKQFSTYTLLPLPWCLLSYIADKVLDIRWRSSIHYILSFRHCWKHFIIRETSILIKDTVSETCRQINRDIGCLRWNVYPQSCLTSLFSFSTWIHGIKLCLVNYGM